MAGTNPVADRARQLLLFYSSEVARLALSWLDANPGQDAVGLVCPSEDERPESFVGVTHEEVARGVVERRAAETFLRPRAPTAADKIAAPRQGKQTDLTVFAVLDGQVFGGVFPLPVRS